MGTFLETRPFHDVDVDLYVTEESQMGLEVREGAMGLKPVRRSDAHAIVAYRLLAAIEAAIQRNVAFTSRATIASAP